MDCDDLMQKDKLRKLQELLIMGGRKHVSTSLVKYFSENELGNGYKAYEKWLNDVLVRNNIYKEIYRECTIPSPSWMMYKEDIIDYEILNNLGIPEDYEMVFKLYELEIKPLVVLENLHFWRDHSERTSRISEDYNIRRFGAYKLKKFLFLEYKKDDDLVLWGSGKKGKELAQILVDDNIEFTWVSGNSKKINHNIYSKIIQKIDSIKNLRQPKVIIAVSNKQDQSDIKDFLENTAEGKKLQFFFFF